MVGAFTVTDDSKQLCTMALGDINSVARRMEDWLSQHPEMASPPPLDVERLARALDDALATNDAHIQHEPSGYHMPAVGLANSIARAYAAEEGS
jgi:hypothetical protein